MTTDDLLRELIERRDNERKTAASPPAVPAPPIETRPESRSTSRSDPRVAFALAGLAIGLLLWPIGARYTLDGLAWIASLLLGFLRIPVAIPAPLPWEWYAILIWIPYLCSRVEWRYPIERHGKRWRIVSAYTLVVWLVVAGLDFLTTYFGLRVPAPDAWPVARDIANSLIISGIIGGILTFVPEWLIRSGWRRLWG